MSPGKFVIHLSLLCAFAAFTPAVCYAQDNAIVRDILSQILGGNQQERSCQPVDQGLYDQRLNRITRHFYDRIHRDIQQGILDPEEAYPYRRRVRSIYHEGQNFVADGCLTQYEKNRFARNVRRLDEELTSLEQWG